MATRVLLLTDDRVGAVMAGPAIRAVELARQLTGVAEVTLGVPFPVSGDGVVPDGVAVAVVADEAALRRAVADTAVVVAMTTTLARHPWLAEAPVAVVADAYDPVLLEVLAADAATGRPDAASAARAADAAGAWLAPLAWADLVLVASERQRHVTLGALAACGRLTPTLVADDPDLRRLVAVVPFGLPDRPPEVTGHPLVGPGGLFPDGARVLWWGGGMHDWTDPLTLVEAVARVGDPSVVAAFAAGPHPSPSVEAPGVLGRVRRRVADLDLGDRVRLVDRWVPYADRAAWMADATWAVTLAPAHLETTFAFRTRVLDALWVGRPVLCSAGDVLADLVADRGLGLVVPPGDPDALAEAIGRAGGDWYGEAVDALAATAPEFTWNRVARPLVEFCAHPMPAADRLRATSPGPSRLPVTVADARALRRDLSRWWADRGRR